MAKRYTKDGKQFYKAGDRVGDKYCVSEAWLVRNGFYAYLTFAEDGEDGVRELSDGSKYWVHFTGAPYVAPEPVPYVPTEEDLAARAELQRIASINAQIAQLKQTISEYDYIGVKIAMGVATREEYADQIAYTEQLRQRINELQAELTQEC